MSVLAAAGLLAAARAEGRAVLLEDEVYALLAEEGLEVPRHRRVASKGEVDGALCRALGAREAVVKVVSPDILHKTEAGGVRACPNTPEAVRDAVEGVLSAARRSHPEAHLAGALVVEKVLCRPGLGREVLAGFRHDPAFGPVVVVGVGGLDTEALLAALRPDRARVVLPAEGLDVMRAVRRLETTLVGAGLFGALRSTHGRGVSPSRVARFLEALAALARRWASFAPPDGLGLSELEVNPFAAADDGRLVALDGLARLHQPAPLAPPRTVGRLRHLLVPKSAVVIGASAESRNAGRVILGNLVEGGGIPRDQIFVVHPRAEAIDGCRAVRSVSELREPVDLAVVAVPAERGAQAVIELVEGRRARTVTLISGGFAETEGGRDIEARMREAIERAHAAPDGGVLVNGGNCLGIISVPGGYNTFFIPPYKLPFHDAPGHNVASISQSGAYLVTQISNLDRAVRPRYAISFGNQVDVTVSDYLEHLRGDEAVRVFAVYLEGFRRGDGARFLRLARALSDEGRTVLLYKAGRTAEGRAAAASHTAAAVGDHEVGRELVRQAGAIDCVTLDMFEDYLMTFSFLAGKPGRGRRVAVLSNAGFECTAAADKLYGLALAELSPETREALAGLLPPGIIDVHNPLDTTPMAPTESVAGCVEAMVADPGVDAVVVAGVPATPYLENLAASANHGEDVTRQTSLPSRLIRIFRESPKPIVFSVDSGALYENAVQMMKRAGLPCFRKVDRATRALAAFLGTYR